MKKLIKINKSRKKYSKNNKNSKRTKSKLNNKNKNNKKVASKLYGGASASLDTKPSFTMLSWNIFWALFDQEYNNHINVQKEIIKYINSKQLDILFVQETPYIVIEKYTCINLKYVTKDKKTNTDYYLSGISIIFNPEVFIIEGKIIRGGFSNNHEILKNVQILGVSDNYLSIEEPNTRPILAVKLKHKNTNKNIIFVNVWAAHDIINKNKKNEFLTCLQNIIIECGYNNGDSIIIAGDFNEYSEQYSAQYKTNLTELTLELQIGIDKIILKSKQNEVSCCGNITGGKDIALPTYWKTKLDNLKFDDETTHLIGDKNMMGYWNTDLLFTDLEAKVNVDKTQTLSDHYPVIAEIEL